MNFEELVKEAVANIPKLYKDRLGNVVFKVADYPNQYQVEKLGLRSCHALYGLYEGVPLTKRGGAVHSIVPDVITIFKYPMVNIYPDEQDLRKQVFETVWHEVAHFFGLNHADIDRALQNAN